MLKLNEIRELINLIDQSSISEFEYEHDGIKITIKKEAEQTARKSQVAQTDHDRITTPAIESTEESSLTQQKGTVELVDKATQEQGLHQIVSPMVGTFYRAPAPDADPYVQEGDFVKEDTVVCIVEAMKLMNEIEAEVKGEIVKVLVENGQLVEYGQPLFLVRVE